MKKRITKGVLFLILSLSLLWSCQDINNELLIEEEKPIETVTITEALDFLESKESQSSAKSSDKQYVTPYLDYIWHEDIISSNELLTIVRASTIYKKSYNRILLLKVNNKIKSVVFSMYPDTDNATGDYFTGSIIITDLNGGFIDGFKINNGSTIAKYLQKSKSDNTKSLKRTHSDNEEFGWILDLEEYEIIASASSSIIYLSFFTLEEQAPDFGEDGGGDSWEYDESGGASSNPIPTTCPDGQILNTNGNCVDPCDTSKEDLKAVFPDTNEDRLQEIADLINKYGKDFGIDNKEKMQHFLAQAGHESTNYEGVEFAALEENLNYRINLLGTDYWQNYFNPITDPTADPNKANPNEYRRVDNPDFVEVERFANFVYYDANRSNKSKLGNTTNSDGYKYRGRGIFQLTGKENYNNFNNFYQDKYNSTLDILNNPDLLSSDITISVISSLWFFKTNVLDKLTIDSNTTVLAITKKVNGGKSGLDHRKELHTKAEANINCI